MERQRHGGARSVGFRPGGGPAAIAYQERTGIKAPRIIAWEITRSCNLSCAHCRAAAEFGHYHGELTLDQIKATIDDIVTISNPIIILTGGEPLMRPDIWEIVDYAQEKGAMPVIGTNATLITDEIAQKMADHKIPRISVSVDFPTAEEHDAFRGQEGCFDATIEGIKMAKGHGVGVQINMTVTTLNADTVMEAMHTLAEELGVDAFHIFMLVPTGRGEDLLDKELPPAEYERVLAWAYERQKTSPLHFKPTDAPHYYRIIRQLAKAEGKKVTREEYGLDAMTRGCLGGITFCFISHVGDIQPCGYFDMQLGNVKEQPFSKIWTESQGLQRAARLLAAQGQVRRLRVQGRVRRVPRARAVGDRRGGQIMVAAASPGKLAPCSISSSFRITPTTWVFSPISSRANRKSSPIRRAANGMT